jgi:spore germination protein YaaH
MPYAVYQTESGEKWFLWYENDASVKAKLELAKLFGIDSISLWRLGTIPDSSAWNWNSLLN